MRELCPLFYGVTYEKMGDMGHVQWPCPTLDHPGTPYLYKDNQLRHPNGQRAAVCRRRGAHRRRRPDDEYPLVLCTVREVGTLFLPLNDRQLRRAAKSLADEPGRVQMNPADAHTTGDRRQPAGVGQLTAAGKVITRAEHQRAHQCRGRSI